MNKPDFKVKNKDDLKFLEVLHEAYSLGRGPKSADYGRTWAESGLKGIYIKLMIKNGRLRELIWKNKEPEVNGESVRDTFIDTINYGVYGIMCLDEDNYQGEEPTKELLLEMREAIDKQLAELDKCLS